jgi:hypothetical protein
MRQPNLIPTAQFQLYGQKIESSSAPSRQVDCSRPLGGLIAPVRWQGNFASSAEKSVGGLNVSRWTTSRIPFEIYRCHTIKSCAKDLVPARAIAEINKMMIDGVA